MSLNFHQHVIVIRAHNVEPGAAVEDIDLAVAGFESIDARPAVELIAAGRSCERVVAIPAVKGIASTTAAEAVIPAAADVNALEIDRTKTQSRAIETPLSPTNVRLF